MRIVRSGGIRKTFISMLLIGLLLSACFGKSQFVTAIAINPEQPQIMFIATNDAVYKTRDGGETWARVTTGLTNARILSLAIHPVQNSTIYAGTMGDAVYRSVDGGNRWSIINAGLKEHVMVVNNFIFFPEEPEAILAATTVGIFQTHNGGLMWEELSNKGMDSVYVVSVALNPTNPRIFYAGTSGGVYKTDNGGQSWFEVNNGLVPKEPGTALSLGVNALLMAPENPEVLYAGTTRGAFKTTDGGKNWSIIGGGLGKPFVSVLLLHPDHPEHIYAGTQKGVFKSLDGGESWSAGNSGLTNTSIRSMVIRPDAPDVLYAGTQGGLFKTEDGAGHWTRVRYEEKFMK